MSLSFGKELVRKAGRTFVPPRAIAAGADGEGSQRVFSGQRRPASAGAVMSKPLTKANFNDPVTQHAHQDFAQVELGQTVGEALDALRRQPPKGRIIYFYVVDKEGRLQGVVPTRRLILSPLDKPLAEIMVRQVIALPAH